MSHNTHIMLKYSAVDKMGILLKSSYFKEDTDYSIISSSSNIVLITQKVVSYIFDLICRTSYNRLTV